jgi:hypothetical protein
MRCPRCGRELVEVTFIAVCDEIVAYMCDCANPDYAKMIRRYRAKKLSPVIEFVVEVEVEGEEELTGYLN